MYTSEISAPRPQELCRGAFEVAFAFLQRPDLAELAPGWRELGDGVRASVQAYETEKAEALDFETHDRFYDIQYIVSGSERIGVVSRRALCEKAAYDPQQDITFYAEPALCGSILLSDGDYVILSPQDAHKPRCQAAGAAAVRKIVVKVPVEA